MNAVAVNDIVIEIKNLKKYYSKKIQTKVTKAVDGISFAIKKGEIFGFLGPNGAGKTTAIRSLLGLLRGVEGEVFILGKKVNPNKDTEYRNHIGYIPGELGLERTLNGLEVCNFIGKLYDKKIDINYVKEISERLQLDLTRPVQELSKGNKQKIGIVAALMCDFEIFIFDEPASGLDPLISAEFYKLLLEKQKKTNCTVLLCSHLLSEVEKYCDRVAIIRRGKIVETSEITVLKEKGLKRFALNFVTEAGTNEFKQFLKEEFSEAEIITTHNSYIEILMPPEKKRFLLHEISERKWDGEYIRDFNISNSSLEEIFMKYYREEKNGGRSI